MEVAIVWVVFCAGLFVLASFKILKALQEERQAKAIQKARDDARQARTDAHREAFCSREYQLALIASKFKDCGFAKPQYATLIMEPLIKAGEVYGPTLPTSDGHLVSRPIEGSNEFDTLNFRKPELVKAWEDLIDAYARIVIENLPATCFQTGSGQIEPKKQETFDVPRFLNGIAPYFSALGSLTRYHDIHRELLLASSSQGPGDPADLTRTIFKDFTLFHRIGDS